MRDTTRSETHGELEDESAVPENTLSRELNSTLQYTLGIWSAASLLIQLSQLTRCLKANIVKSNNAHGQRPLQERCRYFTIYHTNLLIL